MTMDEHHRQPQSMMEMKPFRSQSVIETLVWREKVHFTTCQLLIAQSNLSTGQLVKAVVNSGQILVNIVKMVK